MKGIRISQLALVALVGSFVALILSAGSWYWTKTPLLLFFAALCGLTALQSVLLWTFGFLQGKVEAEEANRSELSRNGLLSEGLFEDDSLTRHEAALKTFKGMGGSFCALILGVILLFSCVSLNQWLKEYKAVDLGGNGAGVAAIFGLISVVLLLGGSFLSGCVKERNGRWIKPVAEWMLFSAGFGIFSAVALITAHLKFAKVDLTVVGLRVGAVIIGIIGVELLLQIVLNLFRPASDKNVAIFESRFLGVVVYPQSIWEQLSETVNYQLGYEATGSQFFRKGGNLLLALVGLQLVGWLIGTSFFVIEPGEQGICLQMGAAKRVVEKPGVYMKMPWPFEQVEKVTFARVKSFNFGGNTLAGEAMEVLLWENEGKGEKVYITGSENSTAASAESLANLHIGGTCWYRVSNPPAYFLWAKNPEKTIKTLVDREVVSLLLHYEPSALMGDECGDVEEMLRKRLQYRLDLLQSGVSLLRVSLTEVRPPKETLMNFNEALSASEEVQKSILEAKSEAAQVEARAQGRSEAIIQQAELNNQTKVARLKYLQQAFLAQEKLYKSSSDLYELYGRMEVLSKANGMRKIIVPKEAKKEVLLNLEEEQTPEIFSTVVPEEE